MVMMECPDAVNTLLHEFFLWQPASASKPKQETAFPPNTSKISTSRETAQLTNVILEQESKPVTHQKTVCT